jgi:hypothetical protein
MFGIEWDLIKQLRFSKAILQKNFSLKKLKEANIHKINKLCI